LYTDYSIEESDWLMVVWTKLETFYFQIFSFKKKRKSADQRKTFISVYTPLFGLFTFLIWTQVGSISRFWFPEHAKRKMVVSIVPRWTNQWKIWSSVLRWRYLYFLLQYQRRKHTISTILDREHRWFLVFKTPLNMSEGEGRTSLEVESK
jgi:hypothetical protein